MLFETLRYLLAGYLLVLAAGSLFGLGPKLLSYPAHGVYSLLRLLLMAVSLGRLQMAPVAARGGSRVRSIRDSYRDWVEERKGERMLLGDDAGFAGGNLNWVSTAAGKPPPYPPGTMRAARRPEDPEDGPRPTLSPSGSSSVATEQDGRRLLIDIEPLDD